MSKEPKSFEIIKPKCSLDEIELSDALRSSVMEVIEDRKYADALEAEGLVPRKTILLYGPPGCGKTSIAHGIANHTSLPLYLVSGAQMVSALVGQSDKNAEEIFRFAAAEECVMLIDEFESFGSDRKYGARYENRLVNTLLVNMETRPPKGITVCATNFKESIDAAILRRFDLILEVPQLSRAAMIRVAENILRDRFDICPKECVDAGKTPSGTVREATNRLRSAVIDKARKGQKKEEITALTLPAYNEGTVAMLRQAYDRASFMDSRF